MRTFSLLLLLAVVGTSGCLALAGCSVGTGLTRSFSDSAHSQTNGAPSMTVATAAEAPKQAIEPTSSVLTIGDVRVTLLSVSRITRLSAAHIRNPVPGTIYPVPILQVDYLVEALGQDAITTSNTGLATVSAGTHELQNPFSNLLSGGGTTSFAPCNFPGLLPAIGNQKRARVNRQEFRGVIVPGNSIDITLNEGFNGQTHEFVFRALGVR